MRIRSIKGLSVLAASVAVSTALGLAGATAASASTHAVKPNATTVCNNSSMPCTNISNLLLNQGNGPDFVQNATGLGAVGGTDQGRKVNLRQASDTRINEDFIVTLVGNLGQLCGTGGANSIDPTSYACLNYPTNYPVYQAQYAPNSTESGYCVGAATVAQGQAATLQKCGGPKTFFIGDLASDITVTLPGPFQPLIYFPLEAAADTSATNALVLTLNTSSSNPPNGLFLQQENRSGGKVIQAQMFTLSGPPGI